MITNGQSGYVPPPAAQPVPVFLLPVPGNQCQDNTAADNLSALPSISLHLPLLHPPGYAANNQALLLSQPMREYFRCNANSCKTVQQELLPADANSWGCFKKGKYYTIAVHQHTVLPRHRIIIHFFARRVAYCDGRIGRVIFLPNFQQTARHFLFLPVGAAPQFTVSGGALERRRQADKISQTSASTCFGGKARQVLLPEIT